MLLIVNIFFDFWTVCPLKGCAPKNMFVIVNRIQIHGYFLYMRKVFMGANKRFLGNPLIVIYRYTWQLNKKISDPWYATNGVKEKSQRFKMRVANLLRATKRWEENANAGVLRVLEWKNDSSRKSKVRELSEVCFYRIEE